MKHRTLEILYKAILPTGLIVITCANSAHSGVYIGLKAGHGYSNLETVGSVHVLYNNGSYTYFNRHLADGNRHGFDGGAFVVVEISHGIGLQTEVRYTVKGSDSRISDDQWVFKYVEIPILTRLKVSISSRTSLFAVSGIELGINVFKEYRSVGGLGQQFTYNLENVNNLDCGLVFGGGISYKFDKFMPQLEFRYVHGLSKIDSDDNFQTVQPEIFYLVGAPWAKNRQLSILAGIAFEI